MSLLSRLWSRLRAAPVPGGGRTLAKPEIRRQAAALYALAAQQAREPAFYRRLSVPDTLDGRFDMVVLHVVLLLWGLKPRDAAGGPLSQALIERMFADMDYALREMGSTDTGVGKRIMAMVSGFYGRLKAYHAALDAPEEGEPLIAALDHNLYGTVLEVPPAHLTAMADYVRREAARVLAIPAPASADDPLPAFDPPPAEPVPHADPTRNAAGSVLSGELPP